jgi:hypothetical protein
MGKRRAERKGSGRGQTYSNLEIHKFLRKSTHLIIKAESIFARFQGREHEITLSLLLPIHNDLVLRSDNLVVDIEGATCLDLTISINQHHPIIPSFHCAIMSKAKRGKEVRGAYSEVESHLRAPSRDGGVETCFLVGSELVCEGRRGYEW